MHYTSPMNLRSRELASLRLARAAAAASVLSLLPAACQKKEAPPAPAPAAAAPAPAPAAAKPPAPPRPAMKKLEWDDPKEWKRIKPSSAMRTASYEIPPVKGDSVPGELNVF